MSQKRKKKLQRRAQIIWRFQGDGIWDVFIGLAAAWLGVIFLFHLPVLSIIGLLPLALVPYALKKWLVAPHASLIKLAHPQRRARVEMGLLMLVVFLAVLWLLKDEPGITGVIHYFQQNNAILTGILFAMLNFYLAYAFVYPRLYFHGLLVFMAFFVDAWLMADKPFGFVIWAGLIIFFSGIYLLLSFLRTTRST